MACQRPAPQLARVVIQPSQIQPTTDLYVKLPFTADFIRWPQVAPLSDFAGASTPFNGDIGAVYGVRINDPKNPLIPMGPDSNNLVTVIYGQIDSLYICQLANGVAGPPLPTLTVPITILCGKDIDLRSGVNE